MSAIDRARRDLERGDHWLARRRLASFLSTVGYDPDVVEELGQISYDMHDAYEAGRMWLTSLAEGDHVEHAINVFVEHAGRDARQVCGQLPRVVRLPMLEAYPEKVQDRLRRLGLNAVIVEHPRGRAADSASSNWGERTVILAFVVIGIFMGTSCCVGAWQIFQWCFGND
jgi:hypothetical protein